MEEKSYFNDDRVSVTNLRLTIEGTTYPLDKISAVGMVKERPSRWRGLLLCCFAIFMVYILGFINSLTVLESSLSVPFWQYGAAAFLFGVGVWLEIRTVYRLQVERASGMANALTSKNAAYIRRIRDSINAALVGR